MFITENHVRTIRSIFLLSYYDPTIFENFKNYMGID